MIHAQVAGEPRRDSQADILEAFFRHTPTCLVLLDREFTFLRVNEAYARACGRAASEFPGHNHFEFYPSPVIEDFRRVVADKKPWSSSARPFVFPDHPEWGVTYWDLAVVPILDAAGEVAYLVFSLHDVTPVVRAEEALRATEERYRQGQKLESIGRLAGGIAHDFNNMLSIIHAYTDMAMSALPPDSKVRADLEEVIRAADRAGGLTKQLLAFGRRQVQQRSVVSLNRVIADLQTMLARLIGEHIELRFSPDADLRAVLVDRGQMEQVVINLVINARDAMSDGGVLGLKTENVSLTGARAAELGLEEGAYVRVMVSDTGTGMDEPTRARVFEPFFTTKAEGQGSGLGLAMVQGIVAQSGGAITVRSEIGAGSVFEMYLPAYDGEPSETSPPSSSPSKPGREETRGTIFVVEDDDTVRALTARVLDASGYTVLSAAGGAEALAATERDALTFDVLLTDLVMPRMSGVELAERLRATRPALKVVYMSGHASDAFGPHFEVPAGARFLPKPLTPDTLLGAVRAALAGK